MRKSAYCYLLYQFNNFIALCQCKGSKKKKVAPTCNCSQNTFLSCHISYHSQFINKLPEMNFSPRLSDCWCHNNPPLCSFIRGPVIRLCTKRSLEKATSSCRCWTHITQVDPFIAPAGIKPLWPSDYPVRGKVIFTELTSPGDSAGPRDKQVNCGQVCQSVHTVHVCTAHVSMSLDLLCSTRHFLFFQGYVVSPKRPGWHQLQTVL